MATESFADFLIKLKEIHEKEVLGLQTKLTELTTERGRDAQRIEELFAKNHQLREQQKVLKENVKVLENRLRAGLCDRCMVAQELAKKKQNEYENSHFQSLQHIFILTNEMNRLKEENKNLKEELKRLRSLDSDRTKYQRALPRESSSTPNSPLALLSPVSRKPNTDKAPSREAEEGYHELPGQQLGEEKSAGRRSSLGSRISPSAVLQEAHALEMTSQRIANQLHGTIALVRPGSIPCLPEKLSARTATSPLARKTSLFQECERSPSHEACLRTNKPDSHKEASSYETLQRPTRKEQLCLLNQHFSLHQFGLRSNCTSADRENSFPSDLLQIREAEDRTRLPEEWEDQAAILELPGAVVYMRDQQLEGTLQFLKHRETLQYLLAQQHQQGFRARMEGDQNPAAPEERLLPPQPRATRGCKEERSFPEGPVEGKGVWVSRENTAQREKAEAAREYILDTPLDLSDYGRGRENLKPASWRTSPKQREADSPNPICMESPTPQTGRSSSVLQSAECENSPPAFCQLRVAKPLHVDNEMEQFGAKEHETTAATLVPSSQGQPIGELTLCDPATNPEIRARVSLRAQKQEPGAQPEEDDAESVKQDSDEPDTSDSEAAATYEHEAHQEEHAEGKHLCTEDKDEALQKKRKRGEDPGTKAYRKMMRGRRKIKAHQTPADAPEITKEMENNSPVCSNEVFEET